MDPLTFIVLIVFSLILALGLLIFAPGFAVCWIASMGLDVGCAYLSAWLEDALEAQEQAELTRWRASLDRKRTSWEQD